MIREYDWSHHTSTAVHPAVANHLAHPANHLALGHSLMSFDANIFLFLIGIWAAFGICWWLIAEAATR